MNDDLPELELDIYDNAPASVVKWIEHVLKADKEHPFSVKEVHLIEKNEGGYGLSIELTEFITFDTRSALKTKIADVLSQNAIQDYDVRIVASNPSSAGQYDTEVGEIEKLVRTSLPGVLKDTGDTQAYTAELELRPTRLLGNIMRILKSRKWPMVLDILLRGRDGENDILDRGLDVELAKVSSFLTSLDSPVVDNIRRIRIRTAQVLPKKSPVIVIQE